MDPLQHVLTNVMCLDADSIAGFKNLEVTSIYDLLSISPRIDLQGEYPVSGGEEDEIGYLSPITIRKVESIQLWFAAQPIHDVHQHQLPVQTHLHPTENLNPSNAVSNVVRLTTTSSKKIVVGSSGTVT